MSAQGDYRVFQPRFRKSRRSFLLFQAGGAALDRSRGFRNNRMAGQGRGFWGARGMQDPHAGAFGSAAVRSVAARTLVWRARLAAFAFTVSGDPIHVDEDIGIAVRKDDDPLREKLNAAIARNRLDGACQKINANYFPFSIY
jgi:hypothetical protein